MHWKKKTAAVYTGVLANMSTPLQIVVCGSIVPDPLQTLEPVTGPPVPR